MMYKKHVRHEKNITGAVAERTQTWDVSNLNKFLKGDTVSWKIDECFNRENGLSVCTLRNLGKCFKQRKRKDETSLVAQCRARDREKWSRPLKHHTEDHHPPKSRKCTRTKENLRMIFPDFFLWFLL